MYWWRERVRDRHIGVGCVTNRRKSWWLTNDNQCASCNRKQCFLFSRHWVPSTSFELLIKVSFSLQACFQLLICDSDRPIQGLTSTSWPNVICCLPMSEPQATAASTWIFGNWLCQVARSHKKDPKSILDVVKITLKTWNWLAISCNVSYGSLIAKLFKMSILRFLFWNALSTRIRVSSKVYIRYWGSSTK